MPIPSVQDIYPYNNNDLNQLIIEEKSYDISQLAEQVHQNVPLLNQEQHQIYDEIIQLINNNGSSCFFIDSPAGTGKTFLYLLKLDYMVILQ